MCGICPDVIASCDQIECGARSPIDENGKRRFRWMHHFTYGTVPCRHVLARHGASCAIQNGHECDCGDEEETE